MNYGVRDMQSIGQEKIATGRGVMGAGEARASTLNERLNVSLDRLQMEADRLERALNRVNGTPTKEGPICGEKLARPVRSLTQVAEEFETLMTRFRNLNDGVDQVA